MNVRTNKSSNNIVNTCNIWSLVKAWNIYNIPWKNMPFVLNHKTLRICRMSKHVTKQQKYLGQQALVSKPQVS